MKYSGDQGNHQGEKMVTSFEGRDKNGEKDLHHTEGNHQEDRFVVFKMSAITYYCVRRNYHQTQQLN